MCFLHFHDPGLALAPYSHRPGVEPANDVTKEDFRRIAISVAVEKVYASYDGHSHDTHGDEIASGDRLD